MYPSLHNWTPTTWDEVLQMVTQPRLSQRAIERKATIQGHREAEDAALRSARELSDGQEKLRAILEVRAMVVCKLVQSALAGCGP